MALDTNLTPEIVNSFNVYIDGVKAIGTAPDDHPAADHLGNY